MDKMYILGIVVMFISYGLGFLTPILRKRVEKTKTKIDDIALDIALGVVKFIDDTLNGKSGESKKQRAVDLVSMKLSKMGINIAKDSIGDFVEKAVTLNLVDKVEKAKAVEEVVANMNKEELVPVGE